LIVIYDSLPQHDDMNQQRKPKNKTRYNNNINNYIHNYVIFPHVIGGCQAHVAEIKNYVCKECNSLFLLLRNNRALEVCNLICIVNDEENKPTTKIKNESDKSQI